MFASARLGPASVLSAAASFGDDGVASSTTSYTIRHGLSDIADHLSNSMHYDLDNAGQPQEGAGQGLNGLLTRQIDRNYDALNRLWKTSTARDAITAPPKKASGKYFNADLGKVIINKICFL